MKYFTGTSNVFNSYIFYQYTSIPKESSNSYLKWSHQLHALTIYLQFQSSDIAKPYEEEYSVYTNQH